MALLTYQVTLGAAATQLTTTRKGVRQLLFMPAAHAYYIGKSNVDSTHGIEVFPTAVQCTSVGPFSGDAPANTNEFYLSGTQNDVIQVLAITH